jgi:hypothetical protein
LTVETNVDRATAFIAKRVVRDAIPEVVEAVENHISGGASCLFFAAQSFSARRTMTDAAM